MIRTVLFLYPFVGSILFSFLFSLANGAYARRVCLTTETAYQPLPLSLQNSEADIRNPDSMYRYVFGFPILLLVVLAFFMIFYRSLLTVIFSSFLDLFILIGVYDLLLLACVSRIRKKYISVSCSMLWLIPNLFSTFSGALLTLKLLLSSEFPRLVIPLKHLRWETFVIIWALGAVGVLTWKTLSHLIFRHQLLKDAIPIPAAYERIMIRQRSQVRSRAMTHKPVLSPAVKTPLTVGLTGFTARLVLPQREYTEEELVLIFRHEFVHLLRRDNAMKFNMVFLCAVCWFLPSVWLGMRQAAVDAELGCDELATKQLSEPQKRQYASMLLETAGAASGFSTCLSASAKGLRYRLQRVLHPETRRSSATLAGILVFLITLAAGSFTFAFDAGTFGEELFNKSSASYVLAEDSDNLAWQDYLADKQLYRVAAQTDRGNTLLSFNCCNGDTALELSFDEKFVYIYSYECTEISGNLLYVQNNPRVFTYMYDSSLDIAELKKLVDWSESHFILRSEF